MAGLHSLAFPAAVVPVAKARASRHKKPPKPKVRPADCVNVLGAVPAACWIPSSAAFAAVLPRGQALTGKPCVGGGGNGLLAWWLARLAEILAAWPSQAAAFASLSRPGS